MADGTTRELAPEERHERTDFKVAVAVWFGIGVAVLTGGALVGMVAVFQSFEEAAAERDEVRAAYQGRVQSAQDQQSPAPEEQLRLLRDYEESALGTYGWVDRARDVVRIPIDKAMEIIVERAPARGGTGGAR